MMLVHGEAPPTEDLMLRFVPDVSDGEESPEDTDEDDPEVVQQDEAILRGWLDATASGRRRGTA